MSSRLLKQCRFVKCTLSGSLHGQEPSISVLVATFVNCFIWAASSQSSSSSQPREGPPNSRSNSSSPLSEQDAERSLSLSLELPSLEGESSGRPWALQQLPYSSYQPPQRSNLKTVEQPGMVKPEPSLSSTNRSNLVGCGACRDIYLAIIAAGLQQQMQEYAQTLSQLQLFLLVFLVVALQDLMQIIAIALSDGLEDIVRKLTVLPHLVLHLLTLLVQPLELPLEALEQLLHLLAQTDAVLGKVVALVGQLYSDGIDRDASFEADAFYLAEVEGPALVVGDEVDQCLLDAQIGELLEVNEELVGHVLQLGCLTDLTQFSLGDLLEDSLLKLLQTVVALTPGGDVALSQSEALPGGLPVAEVLDGSWVGAVLLSVHEWEDLNVLYICQFAGPLLGKAEESFKLAFGQQFLF